MLLLLLLKRSIYLYTRGGNYARRRRDRAIESQEDSEDRQREKTEISEKKELEVHDRSYSRGSISMSQSDSNHMDTVSGTML